MKVLIHLKSGLSDTGTGPVPGELMLEGDSLSLLWTQPPSKEETGSSLNQLIYERPEGVLHMMRKGDYTTELSFSEDARTRGTLYTPHGDFLMEIETKRIFIPEKLWVLAKDGGDITADEDGNCILLRYFLLLSDQEPIQNDISIQISLEKNEDKG